MNTENTIIPQSVGCTVHNTRVCILIFAKVDIQERYIINMTILLKILNTNYGIFLVGSFVKL